MKEVEIYTDGSCLNNPGPGGWASILKFGSIEKMISGGEANTTNNKMELLAVINALKLLKYSCKVTVITDSQYVVNAFNNGWIYNWERQEFLNRKNSDLWKELLQLSRIHSITFRWIRGHSGHHYNELCDSEAQRQASNMRR